MRLLHSALFCGSSVRTSRSKLFLSSPFQQLLGTPVILPGLSSIVDRYDLILLDQFGVLHDGNTLHAGVPEFLEYLLQKQKTTCIVSNTSSRRAAAAKRLAALGVRGQDPNLIITSGEAAFEWLAAAAAAATAASTAPLKVAWITWNHVSVDEYFHGLPEGQIQITPVETADLLFLHGSDAVATSATARLAVPSFLTDGDVSHPAINHVLRTAAARRLPAVCANLDHTAVTPAGTINFMPGLLKKEYERLGGTCVGFGKPHKEFFERAVAAAVTGRNNNKKLRALHIGDSLCHDVAGATLAGIDSVLVTADGVHRAALTDTRAAQLESERGEKNRALLDFDGPPLEKSLLQKVCDLADELMTPRPTFIVKHCRL